MSYLEKKYVSILSSRLKNYKRKSGNLYNFSCPFCNDLEAHPHQGRAYIFEKEGVMRFYCHYCIKTLSIPNFIKELDQILYNEFVMEKLTEDGTRKRDVKEFEDKMKSPVFLKTGLLKGLKKISQLQYNDPMKIFITNRKIPNKYHSKIFDCPNFYSWVNRILPNKFENKILQYDERKIVIPFFDEKKNIFALQGRTLNNKSKVKYITIILDETKPKLYGLDEVDIKKEIYAQEAPFDSMHLNNSIASAGGDIVSAVSCLPKDKIIIIYDNEPRSKETKNKIQKAILNEYKVCIWPSYIEQKDVNDMVLAGYKSDDIEEIIKQNTFEGLKASLKLTEWSKI